MKILALLFCIYILVLPCLTCAETDVCNDDIKNQLTQTGKYPDHENEKEDCGAFCTCSCCVHIVSVNFQTLKIIIDKPAVKNKLLSFYDNISLPSNYFGNIWQPPKFS